MSQRQSLRVVGQPIVELPGRTVVGIEALARFDEGPPSQVFAAARRRGDGHELEFAALRSALELIPELPVEIALWVNLSASTLLDERFTSLLAQAPAPRMVVELTECAHPSELEAVRTRLAPLRAMGLRLALDDVGARLAELQSLLVLRPDIVKLDIAVIAGIERDETRQAVVRAVQQFASDTGTVVVAEGIETEAQLVTVAALGIRLVQGFLLYRPAPVEHLHLV